MMKINLLGQPTPAARPAAAAPSSTRQALTLVIALAVSLGIVGILYYYWGKQIHQEQAALAHEQTRQKELAQVKAQNVLYQAQLAELQQRINTIQSLQSSRTGPVDLMAGIGDTVNRTKGLYLLSVQPAGDILHVTGISDTVHSIADFITALQNSPKFENVQLRQYVQSNRGRVRSYNFQLDCQYKPPAPPPSTGGAAQPAAAAAAGQRVAR